MKGVGKEVKPCAGLQEGWKEPEDGEVVDSRPREDTWWEGVPVTVGEGGMGRTEGRSGWARSRIDL